MRQPLYKLAWSVSESVINPIFKLWLGEHCPVCQVHPARPARPVRPACPARPAC